MVLPLSVILMHPGLVAAKGIAQKLDLIHIWVVSSIVIACLFKFRIINLREA
ncbi:MAG: hypothetical protein V7K15_09605 [Nostoc sp.]